jgi:hypothetical protein
LLFSLEKPKPIVKINWPTRSNLHHNPVMEINITPSIQLREVGKDLVAVHLPTGTQVFISRGGLANWLLKQLRSSLR